MTDSIVESSPGAIEENRLQPKPDSQSIVRPQVNQVEVADNSSQQIAGVRKKLKDIKTNVYKGSEGEYLRRARKGYQREWGSEISEGVTYDGLIASAVERAILNNQDEVVIFDFGCGEGLAMTEFLTDTDSSTMNLIKEHPEITVKLVGLTDTPGLSFAPETTEELMAGTELKSEDEEPKNITAKIDYFGVTAAHPLEDYFTSHDITSIDVAMAVQSLPYLPARNFEAVLGSIITRLQYPGSTFIAAPYATRVPGFKRSVMGLNELDIRTKRTDPSVPSTLRDWSARFLDPETDIEQEGENLQAALKMFINLEVLTQKEVDAKINENLPTATKIMNRLTRRAPQLSQLYGLENSRKHLSNIISLLIKSDMRLGSRRMDQLADKKRNILSNLKLQYVGVADINFDKDVISITIP